MMNYQIIQINKNSWRIEDGGVRFFLLTGTERALLIDSGMMVNNAKDIAQELTDLPVSLLNTHADRDHIGSTEQCETFYMHPAEETLYRSSGKSGSFIPVKEGDIIDLGQRELKIIEIPGHTSGSIGVLDVAGRVLDGGRVGKCTGKHPSVRELCLECSREEGAGPRPLTPRQGHALPDAHSRATPPDAHGRATPSLTPTAGPRPP